jgi:hypothetical protein
MTLDAIQEHELREVLALVYDAEGVDIWVADAKKKGLSFDEAMARASALVDGAYV